jgi:hypothetical protein
MSPAGHDAQALPAKATPSDLLAKWQLNIDCNIECPSGQLILELPSLGLDDAQIDIRDVFL